MSHLLARAFRFPLFVVALCIAGGAAMVFWPLEAEHAATAPREIVLVVRDMAFYVDGNATPNPTIHLKRGERVALTLRNEDSGMTHDFAVADWGVKTPKLRGKGLEQIVFTVPGTAGSGTYVCTPHAVLMHGALVIE
jgi:FtsP/CotA-like multicopper oxidase with cupredoxin domain